MTLILHRKHKMRCRCDGIKKFYKTTKLLTYSLLHLLALLSFTKTPTSSAANSKNTKLSTFDYCQTSSYTSFTCKCDSDKIDCSSKNIKNLLKSDGDQNLKVSISSLETVFFKYLPTTTESLDFSNNKISRSSRLDFSSFENLKVLKLSENRIDVARAGQTFLQVPISLKQL